MFSYLGGKKYQGKWIAEHFPKFNTYVEPFGGAYWTYFQGNVNAKQNVYNDFNTYIANIFHCSVFKRDQFLTKLKSYQDQDAGLFEKFKKDILPLKYGFKLGNIEKAAKYIYIETQTFSGMTISEKTKYVDLKGKYKSKYQHLIDKLENPKWQLKIGNITNVENESFETVIKKYDKPDTLFYVDPPYYKMEDYYTKEFGRDQHLQLANVLKNIKGKFILSYYVFPQLSEWFPKDKYHWTTKEFSKANSTTSKKKTTSRGEELLIMNFKPALTLE